MCRFDDCAYGFGIECMGAGWGSCEEMNNMQGKYWDEWESRLVYSKTGEIVGLAVAENNLFMPLGFVDDNERCEYYNCYDYSTDNIEIEIIPEKTGIVTLKVLFADSDNNFCKENISLQEAIDTMLLLIKNKGDLG